MARFAHDMNATQSAVSPNSIPANPSAKETTKSQILVVEDSRTQAKKLQFILANNGFKVTTCHSGEAALEVLEEFQPDIILSDIIMPGIDGYELCRQVKTNDTLKDIPFILLTRLEQANDVLTGLQCGADQFLTKPWDENFLVSHLWSALKNRDARRDHNLSKDGVYVALGGREFPISADREQILDLLISTYENAVQKTHELRETNARLQDALETINTMQELVPICCSCQKIRDDSGYWEKVAQFLPRHSIANFSHSYCPDCARDVLKDAGLDPDK